MTIRAPRVTLDVVAEAAGVSRMTVSNTYNRPDVVAAATRERVLAAAAGVGYGGPSPVGRTLRRGSTDVLGLLLRVGLPEAFSDPAAAEFMRGIATGCDEAGLSLQIVHATGADAADRVGDAAVDAFVAWSLGAEDPALRAAIARRVPIVAFGGADGVEGVPYVASDNVDGARTVARHLLDCNVDRIATVVCHARTKEFDDRIDGWHHALADAGVDGDDVVVIEQPSSSRACGRDAAAALIELHRPGVRWGVLAMTDVLALGLVQAVLEAGLGVPDDVAVAGFDDIDEAAAHAPGLTTVAQDIVGLGRECALRAAGRITGPTAPHPTSLRVRASTVTTTPTSDRRPR